MSGCDLFANMWKSLKDVFQRKSLMNKMKARHELHTAGIYPSEKMLTCSNRVPNLGETDLNAMGGEVSQMDVAMSVLNGLPSDYESLIVVLDSKGEDELNLDFVKSRLLQEERRQAEKKLKNSFGGQLALVGRSGSQSDRRSFWAMVEGCFCTKGGQMARQCIAQAEQRQVANVAHKYEEAGHQDSVCFLGRASDSKMTSDT